MVAVLVLPARTGRARAPIPVRVEQRRRRRVMHRSSRRSSVGEGHGPRGGAAVARSRAAVCAEERRGRGARSRGGAAAAWSPAAVLAEERCVGEGRGRVEEWRRRRGVATCDRSATPVFLWCGYGRATGKRILSLIALSLDLDIDFFHKNGAFEIPTAFLRLLHYAGDINGLDNNKNIIGAAAHSDYGMLTILATDGTPGLQICREKDRHFQIWEDVHHIDGSLIVNIGDLLERWTNCVFRSTLHCVVPVGKERYSVAFFIDPSPNLVVKCMECCCSEAYPARFAPIKSGDYIEERLRSTYKLATS